VRNCNFPLYLLEIIYKESNFEIKNAITKNIDCYEYLLKDFYDNYNHEYIKFYKTKKIF